VILPLFGGFLTDRFGASKCVFFFLSLCILGQAIFALGISFKSFGLVLLGRTCFGLGGESLTVAESTLLAQFFEGKEIAFAMGINLTVARLGSVLNDNLSPLIARHLSLASAIWFGFILSCACLIGCFGVILTDAKVQKKMVRSEPSSSDSIGLQQMKNVLKCGVSYWLITLSCFIVYGAVLPFNNNASKFLQSQYGYDTTEAGAVMGIPFMISAIGSPILGLFVDGFGFRAVLMTFSAGFLALSHGLMAFTRITPYVTLSILGLGYCVYSSVMWPAIAYVVEKNVVGACYGATTALQNIGLAFFPLIVGTIKDHSDYIHVEYFFLSLALGGVLVGILLNIVDARIGSPLNSRKRVEIVSTEETGLLSGQQEN
jgi:MFS family permease